MEVDHPLVASATAIFVLLHLLVFTLPIESLALSTLTILVMCVHLKWCDAAAKDLKQKQSPPTAENETRTGDRERKLITAMLDFCSKIRHTIAQETERLRKLQKSDDTRIVPTRTDANDLSKKQSTNLHAEKQSHSDDQEQKLIAKKLDFSKFKHAIARGGERWGKIHQENLENTLMVPTRMESNLRCRSVSDLSPLDDFNATEYQSKFDNLKRWQVRQRSLKRRSTGTRSVGSAHVRSKSADGRANTPRSPPFTRPPLCRSWTSQKQKRKFSAVSKRVDALVDTYPDDLLHLFKSSTQR